MNEPVFEHLSTEIRRFKLVIEPVLHMQTRLQVAIFPGRFGFGTIEQVRVVGLDDFGTVVLF